MSHRDNCPTEWEARREGERAADLGAGRYNNPYRGDFDRNRCEEAELAWNRGHRYAEERREEDAAEERAAERRAHERALEAEAHARYQEEQYAEMESAQTTDVPLVREEG